MAAKKKPVVKKAKAMAPKATKAVKAPAIESKPVAAAAPVLPKTPSMPVVAASISTGDKVKKSGKKDKKMIEGNASAGKKKMVRDSFTMPDADYALIGVLKARTLASGTSVKKSELLRAGLVALAAMPPANLIGLVSAMPAVKTGRPGKKKK
jgi:hypothetical protein